MFLQPTGFAEYFKQQLILSGRVTRPQTRQELLDLVELEDLEELQQAEAEAQRLALQAVASTSGAALQGTVQPAPRVALQLKDISSWFRALTLFEEASSSHGQAVLVVKRRDAEDPSDGQKELSPTASKALCKFLREHHGSELQAVAGDRRGGGGPRGTVAKHRGLELLVTRFVDNHHMEDMQVKVLKDAVRASPLARSLYDPAAHTLTVSVRDHLEASCELLQGLLERDVITQGITLDVLGTLLDMGPFERIARLLSRRVRDQLRGKRLGKRDAGLSTCCCVTAFKSEENQQVRAQMQVAQTQLVPLPGSDTHRHVFLAQAGHERISALFSGKDRPRRDSAHSYTIYVLQNHPDCWGMALQCLYALYMKLRSIESEDELWTEISASEDQPEEVIQREFEMLGVDYSMHKSHFWRLHTVQSHIPATIALAREYYMALLHGG